MYKIPSGQLELSKLQDEVLEKWKKEGSFKESIETRDTSQEFVFYDGPPFANGLPHYGHLLTSYVKDSVARFQTMIGNRTERRFGWDCHGLPAEMETEKELKVSGRSQIIEYGIEKFNTACKSSVMKYSKQWQEYINKAGRWVDFEEDYKTMDAPYMESVLWGFNELYKKGLIYEDFRVMPYSWKCETPLSNFETKMDNSYRSHTSKTATVKIPLNASNHLPNLNLFALIWTTTPWTLPSNLAIAVNKEIEYVILQINEKEGVIVAKKLASKYEKELGNNIIKEVKGADLIGLTYSPLFDFFINHKNAFKIINGDFVEEEGGTGLVHIAPGFGEDDWNICKKEGINIVCPVDDSGVFTQDLHSYILQKTERLAFRNITKEDDELIKSLLLNHPEMHFENAEKSHTFYANHLEEHGVAPMVVLNKKTHEVLGIAGILAHNSKQGLSNKNVEVICFLKQKFHGFGFGSEAFKHFTNLAFARFGVESVFAYIKGENKSIKTLKNIGFKYIAEVKDARSGQDISQFELSFQPLEFKTANVLFKKEASLYKLFYNSNIIGEITIQEGNLIYQFESNLQDEIKLEAVNEFIERFAFTALTTKNHDKFLKKLGFFEVKQEAEEKIFKKLPTVFNFAGKQVFEMNDDILSFLKQDDLLIKQEQYIHNYPHCWRTDTPLIYKAVSSWYVNVSSFKDRMVELNKQINWMPSHIKEGQFGKWIANARDWSITRNRFWGTPVPVWKVVDKETGTAKPPVKFSSFLHEAVNLIKKYSQKTEAEYANSKDVEFFNITVSFSNGKSKFFPKLADFIFFTENTKDEKVNISFNRNYVFSSKADLNAFFKTEITDLHRPFIDDLKITDPYNPNQEIVRVSDVLDCWFESGSMPFASVHYPFENKKWFEEHNPADFIVEYVAQTRGWFYTLMVLSTAIFDKIPFKNCLCHGVILDENGQKLSKRLKNYPDPLEVFNTYGSDAMRFFLLSSQVVSGGDLNISKDGAEIRDVVRLIIKPIWNAYTFFAMYANADQIQAEYSVQSEDTMDRYILSKLEAFAVSMKHNLEQYKFPEACKEVEGFIDVLNNWYIRRSKERFWKKEHDADKLSAYNTLFTVLYEFAKIVAPILPFTSESLFTHLNDIER